jgi:hypothetical protein
MNKRVSDLVNQALVGKETYFLSYVPENFFNEFAGLIVKECCAQIGYEDAIADVKKHFGVKE